MVFTIISQKIGILKMPSRARTSIIYLNTYSFKPIRTILVIFHYNWTFNCYILLYFHNTDLFYHFHEIRHTGFHTSSESEGQSFIESKPLFHWQTDFNRCLWQPKIGRCEGSRRYDLCIGCAAWAGHKKYTFI